MYNEKDTAPDLEQFLPFGGHLRKDNRWVQLAAIIPWDTIK